MTTREITIKENRGSFSILKKNKDKYDFSGIANLRKLLSNERARILDTIKSKKPNSIYELSKILGRTFKSVYEDLQILEKFGIIELKKEQINKKKRHKPVIISETITIHLKI